MIGRQYYGLCTAGLFHAFQRAGRACDAIAVHRVIFTPPAWAYMDKQPFTDLQLGINGVMLKAHGVLSTCLIGAEDNGSL
ncbi:hypothetical protein A9513_000965 [Pseudomonas sp. AU12215]|nr:hypothetical protein A9513_000965 [Pseudomonas sp. AU12215]